LAHRQDVKGAEIHVLEAGHFAMDTKSDEVSALALKFLDQHRRWHRRQGGYGPAWSGRAMQMHGAPSVCRRH